MPGEVFMFMLCFLDGYLFIFLILCVVFILTKSSCFTSKTDFENVNIVSKIRLHEPSLAIAVTMLFLKWVRKKQL